MEQLTDEQAALLWSGDTSSIAEFEEKPKEESTATEETTEEDVEKKPKLPVNEQELTDVFAQAEEKTEEDEEEEEEKPTNGAASTEKKPGRKTTDLVQVVNQLVEEEVLFGFEGEEIKTIEDVKDLIKENLKHREESSINKLWDKKIKGYSPQIQAILQYAEKGGEEIYPLLQAIGKAEESAKLSADDEAGQEEVIRQALKMKGFDDEEIKEQIETFKDLDKLKVKAEKFLPELNSMQEKRVEMLLKEQEQRDAQAREASKVYLDTIQNTLNKEEVGKVKLQKEDKAKIYQALADGRYVSLSGMKTNGFVKALEELQFGKNSNYDHFLNIVHMAIDPEGFYEKIENGIKNKVTEQQVRKIKVSKSSNPNTQEEVETNVTKKPVVTRDKFRNPYA